MSIWKMSSSANHPVWVGSSRVEQLPPHVEEAEPRGREQVLHRPTRDEVDAERTDVQVDGADGLVAVGEAQRAVLVRDPRDLGDVLAVTRPVRDRRAAHERRPLVDRLGEPLDGDRRRPLGRTCTTSAPRSSCACAIWPTVGNSYSLITIFGLPPRSSGSALTIPFTPCETDVVTASSAGSACSSRAKAARAVSARSTQCSHSAPFASQPSRYSS